MAEIGWAWTPEILDACGMHEIPAVYTAVVRDGRKLVKLLLRYDRPPAASPGDVKAWHRRGQYTKVPKEQRLVPIVDDPWKFFELASVLKFPRKGSHTSIGNLPVAVANAIASFANLDELATFREEQLAKFVANYDRLNDLDDWMRECVQADSASPEMSRVANLATIGALAESICEGYYPDVYIMHDLFFGMVTCGSGYDGEPCPRDTGLFRPVGKNSAYSVKELSEGRAYATAMRWDSEGWSETREEWPYRSNVAWHDHLTTKLQRDAELDLAKARVSKDEVREAARQAVTGNEGPLKRLAATVVSVEAREKLVSLVMIEVKSREESLTTPATMSKPMKLREYEEWVSQRGGVQQARPARRHCIERGFKENGDPKLRCIDDFRRNGIKQATTTPETVDMPSFLWPAWMAMTFVFAFVRAHRPCPTLTIGLDDMKMAYRMVHAMRRPMLTCLVAWFSFIVWSMVIQYAAGHYFGVMAANNNFSRVPRLACWTTAVFFLVAVTHFVDDFLNVDVIFGRFTAQTCLDAVLRKMGYGTEPTKRKSNKLANIGLGVRTDLSRIRAEHVATVEPDVDKIKSTLAALRKMQTLGVCTAAQSENTVGKGRWLTSQLKGRAGTAALQPFAQRIKDKQTAWLPEMDHSLEFLELVFDDEFKAILEIKAAELNEGDEPILLVWTDASHHKDGNFVEGEDGYHVVRGSIHIYDQRNGNHYVGHGRMPQAYIERFSVTDALIGRGEIGYGIGAMWSCPSLFIDRKVIHFIDNAPALSNLVNGYSGRPDMAQFVNMHHAACIALNVDWYGEWIPSKANIADIMTRPERYHELLEGLSKLPRYMCKEVYGFEITLPPLGDSVGSLKAWMRLMRTKAEEGRAMVKAREEF